MITLAHISDLHFGRENPHLIKGLFENLEVIDPQLIVVSGDLTQRARRSEFLAARSFLDSLQWPFIVIAGNHDISADNLAERFLHPWRKWHLYIGSALEPVVRGEDHIAIGINTARKSGYSLDWSRGRINLRQIQTVAEHLAGENEEKLRVIVAHHPFWIPEKYSHRRIVGRRDIALEKLKKAGADLILSGHIHLAYTHVLNGLIISHAGTTISSRLEEDYPNSFKIIRGDRQRLFVETREWEGGAFVRSEEQVFKRSQGEWIISV
ncbi:MAG: metallophosphoesterase [Desulforhopalus sp.]